MRRAPYGLAAALLLLATGLARGRDMAEATATGRLDVLAFPGAELSARFSAACAALPALGGSLYIPRGNHPSAGPLVCNGRSVTVEGDGPGVSVVVFTATEPGRAGLVLEPGDVLRSVAVRALSLLTDADQTAGNAGLRIAYPPYAGPSFKGPVVEHVEIAGTGNNAHYWGKGLDAVNASAFAIRGVHVRGKGGIENLPAYPRAAMGPAISITGTPSCSDGTIADVNVVFAAHAGYVSGGCEGLHWTNVTGVAVGSGITYADGTGQPGFFIADSHFNAWSTGISIAGFQQGTIHDTLLYKWTGSRQDWIGIELKAAGGQFTIDSSIHDNTVHGFAGVAAGGSAVGLAAPGADGITIARNTFVATDWPFDFAGIGSTNIVTGNRSVATVMGWQKRPGLGTIARDNLPANAGRDRPYAILPAGVPAPNVGASFQRIFHTANAVPTTLTDLTHAEAGRQITLIATDPHTTVASGPRIRLARGVPWTMPPQAALTLVNTGAYWQEIARTP